MRRGACAALLLGACACLAAAPEAITPFSKAAAAGVLPAPWAMQGVPRVPLPEIALVDSDNGVVLRSHARAAAGAAIHPLHAEAEGATLAWRWKIDRVVSAADMEMRSGDDFAARVYVFFDVPLESLPFAERWKVRLARLLHGDRLPTAAICYVWDNRHAPGSTRWSPYSDRVRMVVLESGTASTGTWVDERRDMAADFRAAFGGEWRGRLPAISGVAAGNDTDQTGEEATAWFSDLRLEHIR